MLKNVFFDFFISVPQIKLETYEKEVFEIDLDIAKKFGKLVPVLQGKFRLI